MKLTWNKNKNKNNKKRSLEAIAHYPNLPFEQQKPDAQLQSEEPAASQNHEKSSADSLDSDSKRLAQSFQAQGNMLAEVYTLFPLIFFFFYTSLCPVSNKLVLGVEKDIIFIGCSGNGLYDPFDVYCVLLMMNFTISLIDYGIFALFSFVVF